MNLLLGTRGFELVSVGVISQPQVTLLAQEVPLLGWSSLKPSMNLSRLLIYLVNKYQGSVMLLVLQRVTGK